MKSFLSFITESSPVDRSKDVIIRPADRKHKIPNALTVMMAKHKDHKRGDEAFDFTIMEPKGTRKYKGTVSKLKDEKGKKKQGWISSVEATRGKKKETGTGSTTSGNDLLAIRKAYEKAATALGQAPLRNIPIISRGDAVSKKI